MIARIRGRVVAKHAQALVVDVNGVGYLVNATPTVHRLGVSVLDDREIVVEIHTRKARDQTEREADLLEALAFTRLHAAV